MKIDTYMDVKESVETAWEMRKRLRDMVREYRKAQAISIAMQKTYLADMESKSYFNSVIKK